MLVKHKEILNDILAVEAVFNQKLQDQNLVRQSVRKYVDDINQKNDIKTRIKELDLLIKNETKKDGMFVKLKAFLMEKKLLEEYQKNDENIDTNLQLAFLYSQINYFVFLKISGGKLTEKDTEPKVLLKHLNENGINLFTEDNIDELSNILKLVIKSGYHWNPKLSFRNGVIADLDFGFSDLISNARIMINLLINFIRHSPIDVKQFTSMIEIITNKIVIKYKKINKDSRPDNEILKEILSNFLNQIDNFQSQNTIFDKRMIPLEMVKQIIKAVLDHDSQQDLEKKFQQSISPFITDNMKQYANPEKQSELMKECMNSATKFQNLYNNTSHIDIIASSMNASTVSAILKNNCNNNEEDIFYDAQESLERFNGTTNNSSQNIASEGTISKKQLLSSSTEASQSPSKDKDYITTVNKGDKDNAKENKSKNNHHTKHKIPKETQEPSSKIKLGGMKKIARFFNKISKKLFNIKICSHRKKVSSKS